MGLSYFYSFQASADKSAWSLESFLKIVEAEAKRLDFNPTLVVSAAFDSEERRKFARRLTTGMLLENEALKGVVLPMEGQVFSHDPIQGSCRVIPTEGVVLVVTDRGLETVLGFLRFPSILKDINGRKILETGFGNGWHFRDFVKTPEPRLRQLVKMFADAGFLKEATDDFATHNGGSP